MATDIGPTNFMNAAPLRHPSLVAFVSHQIAALVCGRSSGDMPTLPAERKLAEQFGVGRGVIRESIKRLEMQGLLEVRQGSGARIVDKLHRPLNSSLEILIPDLKERLRQLNETRLAIEPEAARLAALRATPAEVARLWEIQERLVQARNNSVAITIDLEFHRALAEASGNLMFRLILDSLAEIGLESRHRTIGRIGKQTAIEHHAAVIRAIDAHDPAAAAAAMKHHLVAAWKDLESAA